MKSQNLSSDAEEPAGIQSDVLEKTAKKVPSLDETHQRMLEIHLERGSHDCDLDNYLDEWLQAERELNEKYNKSSEADSKR